MDDIKKAKQAAANKKWYNKNKDIVAQKKRERYIVNKDHELMVKRNYYISNKDRVAAYNYKWKQLNKARENANLANYRATKFRATVYMSPAMKRKLAEVYQIAQEASITTGYDWHVDHIVPLSKGGLHTLNNLQVVPATWNLEKNNNNCDRYWD